MPSDLAMAVFFPRYCSNAGKDSKTNAGDYIGSALNEVSDSRTPPAPPNLHAFFRFGIFKSRLRQPGLTSALQTMSGPSTLAQTPSQSISVDLHNALSILLPRGRRSKKKNKKKTGLSSGKTCLMPLLSSSFSPSSFPPSFFPSLSVFPLS